MGGCSFREISRATPNLTTGRNECLGVVSHHSVLDFATTIARLTDPASGVSYHCLIDLDGTRCTFAPDDAIAHHAGVSQFLGRSGCNFFTLGLSFAGDTYVAPLTEAQIASGLEWLAARWEKLGWTPACITDHRQVAPMRKNDLNPSEWERWHAAIVAHFASDA